MALSVTPFVNNNNGDNDKYILEYFSLSKCTAHMKVKNRELYSYFIERKTRVIECGKYIYMKDHFSQWLTMAL